MSKGSSNTATEQLPTSKKRKLPAAMEQYKFKPGDPRINRAGKPKYVAIVRELAQKVAEEIIHLDKDEVKRLGIKAGNVSRLKRMLYDMAISEDPAKQRLFLEYAYGKVPNELDVTSDGNELRRLTEDEQDRALDTLTEVLRNRLPK